MDWIANRYEANGAANVPWMGGVTNVTWEVTVRSGLRSRPGEERVDGSWHWYAIVTAPSGQVEADGHAESEMKAKKMAEDTLARILATFAPSAARS
jgi:hypothetical protein